MLSVMCCFIWASIQEVTSGLFSCQIPNSSLSLVGERITLDKRKLWEHYARQQHLAFLGFNTGASRFYGVLDSVTDPHEVWVAYIVNNRDVRPIPASVMTYMVSRKAAREPGEASSFLGDAEATEFANKIEMYVAVVSSPGALVTSHMGISRSYEATQRKHATHLSMVLHSFAAKLMLSINPDRRYMITTPARNMREILQKFAPPGSVFPFTREFVCFLENGHPPLFTAFLRRNPSRKVEWGFPGCRSQVLQAYRRASLYEFSGPEGNEEEEMSSLLEFLRKNPPVISSSSGTISLFYKNEPWLTIQKTDKPDIYGWLFNRCFIPDKTAPYVVVDLAALAGYG